MGGRLPGPLGLEETPLTRWTRSAARRRVRILTTAQKRDAQRTMAMRRGKSPRTLLVSVQRPLCGVQGQIDVDEHPPEMWVVRLAICRLKQKAGYGPDAKPSLDTYKLGCRKTIREDRDLEGMGRSL